jgi:hypothetical protein
MELRPLGFGEIFDRAITLYIRNFVPFVAMVLVLILPLAILQYILARNNQPQFDQLFRIIEHPELARTEHVTTVFNSPASIEVLAASLLLAYTLWPFALNAVAVGVARLYRDRAVGFRVCYEVVLRRWRQIISLMCLELFVLLGWYFATIVVVLVLVFLMVLLAATSGPFAFFFGFGAAIVGFILMLPMLALLFIALSFAMYSTVIEELSVMASLSLGFTRIFNRKEFARALLFSLASGAILLGATMMFGFVALVAAFAHLAGLEVTIDSVARAAVDPFAVILLAVYYFDVRIRHEAFDLEAGLERLAGASQVA